MNEEELESLFPQVSQRGEELSGLTSQQLLGYIAALLEEVVVGQIESSRAITYAIEMR
jgi:hypothetical protein